MIALHNLTKQFGEVTALKNISVTIKKEEVVGLLGLNGAGKTTTMRLMVGIYKPSKGSVLIDGHNPIDEHVVVSSKIGYLPENNPLYTDMEVWEYISFIAKIKGSNKKDILKLISQTGLENHLNKKIETLSRGFKQRVGLTAALLGDPDILILDEPTTGLDPIEQEKIRHLIGALSKNKTILFSTHILSEVEDVATRLIILKDGSLVYDGKTPKEKGSVEKLFKKYVS